MQHLVEGNTFSISYSDLKENYIRFMEMSDKEFLDNLPQAIHLACIVCYFKEVSLECSIGEMGIVHELVHFLEFGEDYTLQRPLTEVRHQFKNTLKLA